MWQSFNSQMPALRQSSFVDFSKPTSPCKTISPKPICCFIQRLVGESMWTVFLFPRFSHFCILVSPIQIKSSKNYVQGSSIRQTKPISSWDSFSGLSLGRGAWNIPSIYWLLVSCPVDAEKPTKVLSLKISEILMDLDIRCWLGFLMFIGASETFSNDPL